MQMIHKASLGVLALAIALPLGFAVEDNCNEDNHHVYIGKDNYFLSWDGYLMPARKDQLPPDLRYFKQTQK